MKKLIKKISAIGTGAMLVGTGLLGASAALQDFPAPFVTNGVADVQFVIGSGATDDYLGVLDIATTLQAAAVSTSTVNVPGSASTTEIEGGYKVGRSSDPLQLGGNLTAGRPVIRDTQLPELLSDGKLRIDNRDHDYRQELAFNEDIQIVFSDQYNNVPQIFLDLRDGSSRALWTYTFTIDPVNLTKNDGESFEMMGKPFTLDPNTNVGDNSIVLYGSDVTTFLELSEPVTVQSNGQSYTLEIVGGNSDRSEIILDVNGQRRTLTESRSETIAGLEIFVKDVFVTNIPTLSASANLFVGSQKIEVFETLSDVEINGQRVAGLRGQIDDIQDARTITFTYTPYNLGNDVSGFDRMEKVLLGESISDPLFGTFVVDFAGMNYGLESEMKSAVSLSSTSSEVDLTFTNNLGQTVTFRPYSKETPSASATTQDDVVYNFNAVRNNPEGFGVFNTTTNLTENAIFALNDGTGSETNTKLYKVTRIYSTSSGDRVELEDLMTGNRREYRGDGQDFIGDTNVAIAQGSLNVSSTPRAFRLTSNTTNELYLQGGKSHLVLNADAKIDLVESDDLDSQTTMVLELSYDDTTDREVKIAVDSDGTYTRAEHRANREFHYLSTEGSYVVSDNDRQRFVNAWIVREDDHKVEFDVFVAPEGASVTSTGTSGGSVVTQTVNPIGLGIAVRDVNVNVANPSSNLIVLGGTCINTVAAALKDVSAGTCGVESGLNPNEAIIELFNLDNGKVAMLVAGWEATETQAAARAVASRDSALVGNSVKLTVSSATNYQIQ